MVSYCSSFCAKFCAVARAESAWIEPGSPEWDQIGDLLGREPRCRVRIVVRDATGSPAVIQNEPFFFDGRPMPTRYWLCDPELVRAVGSLESTGAVDEVEAEIGLDALAELHRRHAADRDASIGDDHQGPRPFGGIGGTRVGVKCLHAHYANFLAGEDDPVGRWVDQKLDQPA